MNNNDCDRCGREAELYYDEESGLALCDTCTTGPFAKRVGAIDKISEEAAQRVAHKIDGEEMSMMELLDRALMEARCLAGETRFHQLNFDVLIESLEAARKRTIEVSRGMKELEETLTAMRETSDMLADLYRIGERD